MASKFCCCDVDDVVVVVLIELFIISYSNGLGSWDFFCGNFDDDVVVVGSMEVFIISHSNGLGSWDKGCLRCLIRSILYCCGFIWMGLLVDTSNAMLQYELTLYWESKMTGGGRADGTLITAALLRPRMQRWPMMWSCGPGKSGINFKPALCWLLLSFAGRWCYSGVRVWCCAAAT